MSNQQQVDAMLTYEDFKAIMQLTPVTKTGSVSAHSSGVFICSCFAADEKVTILYWGTICALVWEDNVPHFKDSLKDAIDIINYHHAMNC